jgi:hypothetical protein
MSALATFLRILAPICILVGALHLVLGLHADVLLGARIPADVIADPTLDSQNRFYGTSFTIYGTLLWLCASDLAKYAPVLRRLLAVFFAGGLARLVSMAVRGAPTSLVLALMAMELVVPLVTLGWLSRATAAATEPSSA